MVSVRGCARLSCFAGRQNRAKEARRVLETGLIDPHRFDGERTPDWALPISLYRERFAEKHSASAVPGFPANKGKGSATTDLSSAPFLAHHWSLV